MNYWWKSHMQIVRIANQPKHTFLFIKIVGIVIIVIELTTG